MPTRDPRAPTSLTNAFQLGAVHLAVEPWNGGSDVDVSDAPVEHVVGEVRLELGSVVGLVHSSRNGNFSSTYNVTSNGTGTTRASQDDTQRNDKA